VRRAPIQPAYRTWGEDQDDLGEKRERSDKLMSVISASKDPDMQKPADHRPRTYSQGQSYSGAGCCSEVDRKY
jgi:hypothetical protein